MKRRKQYQYVATATSVIVILSWRSFLLSQVDFSLQYSVSSHGLVERIQNKLYSEVHMNSMTQQTNAENVDCVDGKTYKFELLDEDSHIRKLDWLCISHSWKSDYNFSKYAEPWVWYLGNTSFQLPRKICSKIPQKQLHSIHSEKNPTIISFGPGFRIKFSKNLPQGFEISNKTAYFIGKNNYPKTLENFYHFTKQVFFPLYYMIKSTSRLQAAYENAFFYDSPLGRCPGKFVPFKLDYVKQFFDMLDIKDPYTSAFGDLPNPNKICYKTAVFSKSLHLNHGLEAVEFIKHNLRVSSSCRPKIVTFIGRTTSRRILNIEELVQTAKELGYEAQVVHLERLSWSEQAQIIHCSEVLVGATGAGLHWAYFMRNHSGVVEIAWPQHQWPFFFSNVHRNGSASSFSNLNGIRPLRFATVKAAKCHLNPKALNIYYKSAFGIESNLTLEESLQILQNNNNYNFKKNPLSNLGKLCDVTVDPSELKKAFGRLQDCQK